MWTKMAAWKNQDFDFGVHKNHPSDIQGVPQHWTPENLAKCQAMSWDTL